MLSIQAVRGLTRLPVCTGHCSLHYLFLQAIYYLTVYRCLVHEPNYLTYLLAYFYTFYLLVYFS